MNFHTVEAGESRIFRRVPVVFHNARYLPRLQRAGLRQRMATGPGMVSVHWAAGALGIVTGMTKNLFAVFRFRPALVLGGALWMGAFCLGPVVMLGFTTTRSAGVVALAAVAGFYVLSARTSRISWVYALSFPIAAIAVVYSMFRSTAITLVRGGVSWRGTFYSLKELREQDRKRD